MAWASQDQPKPHIVPKDRNDSSGMASGLQRRVGTTVLLVEDNSIDAFVIRKVLSETGVNLEIVVAKDGSEALNLLHACEHAGAVPQPGLVLLDLNIPKISGLEILRELRASAHCRAMPVIVVTSSNADSDREAAQRLGADGYFRKPTSIAGYRELQPLVKEVLGRLGEGGACGQ